MSEATQEQSSQFAKTMPWLIGLFVFVLSLLAGARTVSDADHAEFATVAFYGGIAHPPGYPLYSLLLRAVAAFGTDVWLLSGLSAGFAGLAAFIYWKLLARLQLSLWATSLATLWTFTSVPVWRMATWAEPFALHLLTLGLILWATQWAVRCAEDPKPVLALGFVWGLAFCNHHTAVFLIPTVVWVVLASRFDVKYWLRRVPLFAGGFCLGLWPLFYFLLDHSASIWVWGDWNEAARWWTHLFRLEYGALQLVPGESEASIRGLVAFAKSLPEGWGFVALVVLLFGAVSSTFQSDQKTRRIWGRALGLSFLLYVGLFLGAMNVQIADPNFSVTQRFFAQAYWIAGFYLAFGLEELERQYRKRSPNPTVQALLPVVLILHVTQTFGRVDRSKETFVQSHAANILAVTQPGDVLVTHNDLETFSLLFMNQRLGKQVHVLPVGMLGMPWFRDRFIRDLKLPQNIQGPKSLFRQLNKNRRLIWVEPNRLVGEAPQPDVFYPLGPVFIVPAQGQETPSPTAIFNANKKLYDAVFELPRSEEAARHMSRVEQELFRKYAVSWRVLCDSLTQAKLGSMHEACIRAQEKRKKP